MTNYINTVLKISLAAILLVTAGNAVNNNSAELSQVLGFTPYYIPNQYKGDTLVTAISKYNQAYTSTN